MDIKYWGLLWRGNKLSCANGFRLKSISGYNDERFSAKRYAKLMPMKSFIDNDVRVAMRAGWPTAAYNLLFFSLTHMGASL